MTTWPYWPRPPDCRTNLPSASSTALADRFAVSHLGLADVGFHAEFALHAVDQNFEVEFAHAGNDGLARLFIRANAERRVFLRQALQRDAHLFLVALGLGLHGLRDHRLREHHALQQRRRDSMIAQRFAGGHVLQAHARRRCRRPELPLISSRLFACICRMRPMRSFLPLMGL